MNVTNKRYQIALKYKDRDLDSVPKYQIEYDLEDLGISMKPFYDKKTMQSVLAVVCSNILEEGIK